MSNSHYLILLSLVLYCNFCQNESVYISGNKNRPRYHQSKQDLASQRVDQSIPLTEESEPKFTYVPIQTINNTANGQVKFDSINNIIYFLTFTGHAKDNGRSSLYVSYDMGKSSELVELKYNDKILNFTHIHLSHGVSLVHAAEENVVAVSLTSGKTWKIMKMFFKIRKFLFHPIYPMYIAYLDTNNLLFATNDNELNFRFVKSGVEDAIWDLNFKYIYYLQDTRNFGKQKVLFKESVGTSSHAHEILKDVISIESRNNFIYATRERNMSLELWISYKDEPFRKAHFPSYLKPKDFKFHSSELNEIFVGVVNATGDIHLYSGLLVDLKFVRILSDLSGYLKENSTGKYCIDIETFRGFPGTILTQKKFDNYPIRGYYSAISFTNGADWRYLNAPYMFEGKPCQRPNCYIRLMLECENTGNKHSVFSSNSSNIKLALGVIINNTETSNRYLFISTDAGRTWITAKPNLNYFAIVNDGGAILAYPEYSSTAFYSFNFGQTWRYSKLDQKQLRVIAVFSSFNGNSMIATSIVFNKEKMEWAFLLADFSPVFKEDCQTNDYDQFTPGEIKRSDCYQGVKDSFYKRKHDAICRSIDNKLAQIRKTTCPCTEKDFGCAVGYYKNGESCIVDPDYVPSNSTNRCYPGEFVFSYKDKTKLHGDFCRSKDTINNMESNICLFTEDDDFAAILIGNNIKYISLNINSTFNVYKIPVTLSSPNINAFALDLKSRCLYYVNKSVIAMKCWGTKDAADLNTEAFNFGLPNIIALKFDPLGRNLYIQNTSHIYSISVDNTYPKFILSSKLEIEYFSILPYNKYMAYSILESSSGRTKKYQVTFTKLNGEFVSMVILEGKVLTINYKPEINTAIIYTMEHTYNYSLTNKNLETFNTTIDELLKTEYRNNLNITITKKYIQVNQTTIMLSDIIDANIYFSSDKEKNPCSSKPCEYICYPSDNGSFTCSCPLLMISIDATHCKCEDQYPNCHDCRDRGFKCTNGLCVSKESRCNGVNDCGDNSDEMNCDYKCYHDQLTCGDNTTCVDSIFVCDGNNDCPDGLDEKNCPEKKTCPWNNFKCFNGACIPIQKYCDMVKDCDDNTDEDSCKITHCNLFEVRCNDGQCILPIQICNGYVDCLDGSDERNCKISKEKPVNPNCTLECDNKCIPSEKICDHFNDCRFGQDEFNCDHIYDCPCEEQEKCIDDIACYPKKSRCDGFSYCKDGSDQFRCREIDQCKLVNNFICETGNQCIEDNKYCDNSFDCDDKSDEGQFCLDHTRIINLFVSRNSGLQPNLKWDFINPTKDIQTEVKVYEWNCTKPFFHQKVKNNTIDIINLTQCKEYTATVRILGEKTGRSVQFIAKSQNIGIPNDLNYNKFSSRLSWSARFQDCVTNVFYIECTNSTDLVYRNFSNDSSISLPFNPNWECRTASCPIMQFNFSCSPFSSAIKIYQEEDNKFARIGLPIIIVIIVILVLAGFLLYLKRKNLLPTLRSILFKIRGYETIP